MKKTLLHFLSLIVFVQTILLLSSSAAMAGGFGSVNPDPLLSIPGNRDYEPVVVGTGTNIDSNTPIYPYYSYSYSQSIYLQTELNFSNKIITQIGYHYGGDSDGIDFDIEVWLSHTDLTALTQVAPLSNSVKVEYRFHHFYLQANQSDNLCLKASLSLS